MEPMAADPFSGQLDLMPTPRRRPAQSPVAFSRLAWRAWRVARPFAPLALLAIVFGLSLGIIRTLEAATPPRGGPPAVSSPAPGG